MRYSLRAILSLSPFVWVCSLIGVHPVFIIIMQLHLLSQQLFFVPVVN